MPLGPSGQKTVLTSLADLSPILMENLQPRSTKQLRLIFLLEVAGKGSEEFPNSFPVGKNVVSDLETTRETENIF